MHGISSDQPSTSISSNIFQRLRVPEFRPGFNALGSCHWRCALDLPDGDLTPTAVTFNCSMAGGLVKSVNKGMMFRRTFLKMGIIIIIIIIIIIAIIL